MVQELIGNKGRWCGVSLGPSFCVLLGCPGCYRMGYTRE